MRPGTQSKGSWFESFTQDPSTPGAAMLNKKDLSTIIAGTNQETLNPLFYAEVQTINSYYNLKSEQHVDPKEVLFLATHEPCTLCSSAITWAGFDNFYYFFSHEDSRDSFQIGHDLNILKEVFKHDPGEYARTNNYWTSYCICDLIENCDSSDRYSFNQRATSLRGTYQKLSSQYQQSKGQLSDPAYIPLNYSRTPSHQTIVNTGLGSFNQ
ncbi:nucleoside deaminase [Synechococcus sp. BIOS-E4-1]|uniref:nucleoside deaminase n=1 Tax=Synechococcus sp. BIOS-E4-1 TaxID=1400864 RepID=UPI002104183D|nr:nucleoside deaminase [Synechococcus sp. BIOS-E4-1]